MKKIFLICLLATNITYGQTKPFKPLTDQLQLPEIKLQVPSFPDNLSNDFLKKDFKLNADDPFQLSQEYVYMNYRDMRAKFSHNTPNGSVYDLVYDNMPCLVPDIRKTERMPVHKLKDEKPTDKMPNPIPHINMIP
jgi:hypothetical protein